MPEYLSPGVYIEEIPSGPVPIEGVSTSTAGFVGLTVRGPDTVRLITSWLDYVRWYGGYTDPGAGQGYLPYAIQGFFNNGGKRAYIARVKPTGAAAASAAIPAAAGNSRLPVRAVGTGTWGNSLRVFVFRGELYEDNKPTLKNLMKVVVALYKGAPPDTLYDPTRADLIFEDDYVGPEDIEVFDNVVFDPDAPNYVVSVVNGSSRFIALGGATHGQPDFLNGSPALLKLSEAVDVPNSPHKQHTPVALAGGNDGGPPGRDDYTGDADRPAGQPDKWTGLAALEAVRDVALVCVPDHADVGGLTGRVVQHCERLKNRFCVLHKERGFDPSGSGVVPDADTSYGAQYLPWINIVDPAGVGTVTIPPSGHVTGVIARTDLNRGVHKAPANEDLRGILVQDLGDTKPLERMIDDGTQASLNPVGLNVIRDFRDRGRGVKVWGARTMSSDGQWKYINVRRLFIFVEESVRRGTQWVVFEPNDAYTWQRVASSVRNFLTTVWKNGALVGATPEEAFFVRCDLTTMTPDDIDNGRLVCLVGIAPVKPAEFVIFRFSQKTIEAES